MDILLTQSYLIARDPPERKIMRPFPPSGIMSLASVLRFRGFDVAIHDNTFEPNLGEFGKVVSGAKPKLVGISSVETTRQTSIEMTRIARDSGSCVILGGPDPIHVRGEIFKAGASWICHGEGEETLLELAYNLIKHDNSQAADIKGLYFIEDGKEVFTGKRNLIHDLDTIPQSAWDMIPVERYMEAWREKNNESALHMMSSRGCTRRCKWCSKSVFGNSFRRRSSDLFVDEIKFLKETYSPDYFWFADDSFTTSETWLCDFESKLLENRLSISYECLGRVDEITDKIAHLLKRTGARLIWLGAESGSQRILDSMNKGFKVEDIYRAREILKSVDIKTGFFIMFGYPPENLDDINKTVDLVRELKPDKVGVSIAYPISGTDFHHEIIGKSDMSKTWKHSSENRPIFKTKYPNIFYFFAKRLICKQSQISINESNTGFFDSLKLLIYKTCVKLFSLMKKSA